MKALVENSALSGRDFREADAALERLRVVHQCDVIVLIVLHALGQTLVALVILLQAIHLKGTI